MYNYYINLCFQVLMIKEFWREKELSFKRKVYISQKIKFEMKKNESKNSSERIILILSLIILVLVIIFLLIITKNSSYNIKLQPQESEAIPLPNCDEQWDICQYFSQWCAGSGGRIEPYCTMAETCFEDYFSKCTEDAK